MGHGRELTESAAIQTVAAATNNVAGSLDAVAEAIANHDTSGQSEAEYLRDAGARIASGMLVGGHGTLKNDTDAKGLARLSLRVAKELYAGSMGH